MRTSNGFVLVFALDNRSSFEKLLEFTKQLSFVKDIEIQEIPVVLVG
jgi:hypothetical protein